MQQDVKNVVQAQHVILVHLDLLEIMMDHVLVQKELSLIKFIINYIAKNVINICINFQAVTALLRVCI